ncbi:uncharacterized protein LOC119109492 isoform X2 [Pollicipes pollicipes]|uniref:uncharacterized protein LOC119109492 isoform X2 n=1 Tax=Pollicipes pollicipes TaxID=41117 RepID=UPI00188570DF|nr:uncharacterized protein LOC119109492 isoform X2 [Pollicipes pollicipes]
MTSRTGWAPAVCGRLLLLLLLAFVSTGSPAPSAHSGKAASTGFVDGFASGQAQVGGSASSGVFASLPGSGNDPDHDAVVNVTNVSVSGKAGLGEGSGSVNASVGP